MHFVLYKGWRPLYKGIALILHLNMPKMGIFALILHLNRPFWAYFSCFWGLLGPSAHLFSIVFYFLLRKIKMHY